MFWNVMELSVSVFSILEVVIYICKRRRWKKRKLAFSFTYQRRKSLEFDPWFEKIPLEKEMATHSSILAWKIPWTEDPGGLQSMGFTKDSKVTLLNNNRQLAACYGVTSRSPSPAIRTYSLSQLWEPLNNYIFQLVLLPYHGWAWVSH